MFDSLLAFGSAVHFMASDALDLLGSSPKVQVQFVEELAKNLSNRIIDWPRGIIPRNYTEHGISEMILEDALVLAALPVTFPLGAPALVVSAVCGQLRKVTG